MKTPFLAVVRGKMASFLTGRYLSNSTQIVNRLAIATINGVHQLHLTNRSKRRSHDGLRRFSPYTPATLSPAPSAINARCMTTAYAGDPGDGMLGKEALSHLLPFRCRLKDGRKVEVDFFLEDEWYAGMALMNLIIREGKSWPYEAEFRTMENFRGYFLSHTAFVVRALEPGMDATSNDSSSVGEVLGCFYIKPNFPGRCSHICNGGFISAPRFRGIGVASIMGRVFLRAARDLGYKSSYFNLVFKSNIASIALWEKLGFKRVAVLEKAAKLEGVEGLDTAYGYRYDLETLAPDYLGVDPIFVTEGK